MAIYALGDLVPDIHADAYVHPDATVIGQVTIGAESTVWPSAVLRGDYGRIEIGARTSVQDGTVIHATQVHATRIGNDCIIGHLAHLEGCLVEDHVLIGSGSVVLHDCVVHSRSVVGANALLPNGTEVPSGALAVGIPAQIKLDRASTGAFEFIVDGYVANGRTYAKELRRLDG
jgi:carbonic anhydrase/acetyltransferase-like protein (isoleucine patch superfamily)